MNDRTSQLYIISEGPHGPVKIGRSMSAGARALNLQTGNPRPLRVIACWTMPLDWVIEAEQLLHDELEDFALVGEWFSLSEALVRRYMPDFFLSNGFEVAA